MNLCKGMSASMPLCFVVSDSEILIENRLSQGHVLYTEVKFGFLHLKTLDFLPYRSKYH